MHHNVEFLYPGLKLAHRRFILLLLAIGLFFQRTHSTPWEAYTAELQFEIGATGYTNTDTISASLVPL
jgi:hypothetical protein